MTSTPLGQMLALPQRLNQPPYQPEQRTIPPQRFPVFFASRMQRYPVPLPPRPSASYNVPTPGFYNHRDTPPNQSHINHFYHSHLAMATLPPSLPIPCITIVSPHIAGWMKIADDVVGSHPFAKSLLERVASEAEIDLISAHVHIPWAHDARRSQRTPLKVLGPAQDAQKPLGLSASAENTRGGFPLGANRFGYDSPSRTVPINQDQAAAQSDH